MNCQARMGLLVLRHCEEPAIGVCASCGTPVCAVHQVMGTAGIACPECAATQGMTDDQAQEAASRRSYYDTYGDQEYFTDADYQSLRRTGGPDQPGSARRAYDPQET